VTCLVGYPIYNDYVLCISCMTYNIEFGNKTYRNSIVIHKYNYFEIEPMGTPNSLFIIFPL